MKRSNKQWVTCVRRVGNTLEVRTDVGTINRESITKATETDVMTQGGKEQRARPRTTTISV
jgi:hypothetical protein